MRRYVVILAGLSVIPTGIACQHTAGKCDCNPITPPCSKYGLFAGDVPVTHQIAPVPVIKEEAPKKAVLVPESPATPDTPATLPGVSGF